jgi:molecular chaperone DnaK
MSRIIGIDLGTTYSCVSVFDDRQGKFVIVPGRSGAQTTPSVVGVTRDGQVVVGASAKARMAAEPESAIAEIKRHMGEPQRDGTGRELLGADGKPVPYSVRFAGREHTPEMVSAYILRELKEVAETYLGEPVASAVITVPAYFKGGARRATEDAGALAGLKVACLVSEPTAAAIAFGMTARRDDEDEEERPRRILVYDLGGGTFDVSVIEISRGNIEVKGVGGDHQLGGVDFDRAIVDWALRKIQEEHGVDLRTTDGLEPSVGESWSEGLARIASEAEKVKVALSAQQTASLTLPFLFLHPGQGKMVSVDYALGRSEFLTMIAPKLKATLATVDRTLADVKLGRGDIDDVLLVGGSTRIPKVQELLERHFGKAPRRDINPDECVALGAAMQALRYVDVSHLGQGRSSGSRAARPDGPGDRRDGPLPRGARGAGQPQRPDPEEHADPGRRGEGLPDRGRLPDPDQGARLPGRGGAGEPEHSPHRVRRHRAPAASRRPGEGEDPLLPRRQRHPPRRRHRSRLEEAAHRRGSLRRGDDEEAG